jgi:hypothetical protein
LRPPDWISARIPSLNLLTDFSLQQHFRIMTA